MTNLFSVFQQLDEERAVKVGAFHLLSFSLSLFSFLRFFADCSFSLEGWLRRIKPSNQEDEDERPKSASATLIRDRSRTESSIALRNLAGGNALQRTKSSPAMRTTSINNTTSSSGTPYKAPGRPKPIVQDDDDYNISDLSEGSNGKDMDVAESNLESLQKSSKGGPPLTRSDSAAMEDLDDSNTNMVSSYGSVDKRPPRSALKPTATSVEVVDDFNYTDSD
jgi:hypothetical protein